MLQNEQPEIVIEEGESFDKEVVFDDIPQHTELTIHIGEEGKEDSYVEYQRADGSIRRLVTQKGGGELRIRTERK